ncbi:MAG TPA: hypothetical protein VGE62_01875 [Candidatus Paceibacterota bacterium]
MDTNNAIIYAGVDKDEPLTRGFAYENFATREFLLNDYTKIIGDIMDSKIERRISPLEEKLDRHIAKLDKDLEELKEMNRDSKRRIATLEREVFGYAS